MITAFHPSATFSVRFVRVLVSTTGEKVHAAGEKRYLRGAWCLRDRTAAVRDAQAAWHRPAVADHHNVHRTDIQNQAADAT
jgi:hypothetical protein